MTQLAATIRLSIDGLAIDRGNNEVKWQACLANGMVFSGKFASLLLKNPEKKINPVSINGTDWLYGSYAGKVGFAIAKAPSQTGVDGKVSDFAVVLAAVLQELSKHVELEGEVVIEQLGITNPISSPLMTQRYKDELTAAKLKSLKINDRELKVTIKKDGIKTFAEASVILERVEHDIVIDSGFGTVLGYVRGWGCFETLSIEHGVEQVIKKISTHPAFLDGLANTNLKASPSIPSIAIQLAKGSAMVSKVDTQEILEKIVPEWFEAVPMKLLPQLRRWAIENGRDEKALLTGGGARLLALALGGNLSEWEAKNNCEIAWDADFRAVQSVSELIAPPKAEGSAEKKQAETLAAR